MDYKERKWVEYSGQECIIINEFRGEIPYSTLLEMCDCNEGFEMCKRGIGGLPWIPKHIFITSVLPPEKIYKKRDAEDSLYQLLRRINIYRLSGELVQKNNKNIFVVTKHLENKAQNPFIIDEIKEIEIDNSHIPYEARENKIIDHKTDNLFLD
jgi:hypothetical protein